MSTTNYPEMSLDDTNLKGDGSCHKQSEVPAVIESRNLLGKKRQVIINHKGINYYLSVTRQDRLILTK